MVAHEFSEHPEGAKLRDIGEATLEQFRADVTRLAREFLTGPPLPLFQEMRRVRTRMYAALDKQLWPRDQAELYLLLSALHALMANAAQDLGYSNAAEELLRAGWVYAQGIDHRPLMGFLRGALSSVAYWDARPGHARDLAYNGVSYLPDGPGAAHLHLLGARAAARLGDAEAVRRGVEAGRAAAERPYTDDLHDEIGGEFACSPAYQASLAGSAFAEVPETEREAVPLLQRAISLYGEVPAAERSYGTEAMTRVNLSRLHVRLGDLDAVDLEPVFELPADKRIDALLNVLESIHRELAAPRYRGNATAAELRDRIEVFGRETVVKDLRELPSGG
ncbi:XRE family transcriptional regulator [Actinomadura miaoliensis]|uniref:XRE family transcriptional regulator n=1 Tax=Actinomadura miaoliensis TaxID=430685 RepID=A0ABP7WW44_9ACTN